MIEEGTILKIEMEVRLPAAATEDQIEEWLKSEVAFVGGVSNDNPLRSHGVEEWGPFGLTWEDTGDIGREEEFDHEETGPNSRSYKVRYVRNRKAEAR